MSKDLLKYICSCETDFLEPCCTRLFLDYLEEERSQYGDKDALDNVYISLQKKTTEKFQKIKKNNFVCLEDGCESVAIKSHIISKSSHLKKLLGITEHGSHLIGVKNNWNTNNDLGKISFVSVTNHQTTMPCFCELHDKQFNVIDNLEIQSQSSLEKYFKLAAYRVIAAEIQMEEIYIRLYENLCIRKMLFFKNIIEKMNKSGTHHVSQDLTTLFKSDCISSLKNFIDFHKERKNLLNDYFKKQKSLIDNNFTHEVENGSIFIEIEKPELFIHSVTKEAKECSWVTMTSLMYRDENGLEKNGVLFNYMCPEGAGGSRFVKEIYKRLFFSKHDFSILASTFLNTSQKSFVYLSKDWYESLPEDHKEIIIALISLKDDMENYVKNFREIFGLCQEKKGFGVNVVNRKIFGDIKGFDNVIRDIENSNNIPSEEDCEKFYNNDYKLIMLNIFLSKILELKQRGDNSHIKWVDFLYLLNKKGYFSFSKAEFIFIYEYMSKFQLMEFNDFADKVADLFGFKNNFEACSHIKLK